MNNYLRGYLEGYMNKAAAPKNPSSDAERNDASNNANDMLQNWYKYPEPKMDPKAVAELEAQDKRRKAFKPAPAPKPKGKPSSDSERNDISNNANDLLKARLTR